MEENTWTYETVETIEAVRIKVPRKSDFMEIVEAHTFAVKGNAAVKIPRHWKFGQMVPVGKTCVFMNRHYFGIAATDLGKSIVATIEVVKKFRGEENFLMLNVRKAPFNTKPGADIKFIADTEEGHRIPGTNTSVVFIKREEVADAA